ncbi:hypothetical protein N7510_001285 [Penicillium lagena]|uniref:uncharacterized protein n=1 Tax=Penicillium lagena TaxID=94218 RepID=UPI0025416470|nr:uncharacterized protein N7510_001285 [Penicillium lagena]KAJ5624976.1 hypothetical protein N7510_001285 [Penicillium lagena]
MEIATPQAPINEGATSPPRNVDTDLIFWRRPADLRLVSDFTKVGREEGVAAMKNLEEEHRIHVHDLHGHESDFSLHQNGFQYVWHEIPELGSAADEEQVQNFIIPRTEDLVKKLYVGILQNRGIANQNIQAPGPLPSQRTSHVCHNRAPAHSVHSDFTVAGALRNLANTIPDSEEREQLLSKRVMIVNIWRPLKTVTRDPLAVCDWGSLNHKNDGIANRLVLPGGGMSWGRSLVFLQFDSERAEEGGVTVPHTAFVDPAFRDGPPRESIEIKMFAFF